MIRLFLILLISCGNVSSSKPQRDLSGPFYDSNGKCLQNIGHRLGGDFGGLRDNSLRSASMIKHLENHKCFYAWEFDINSAKDAVIVYHNTKYDGHWTRHIRASSIKKAPLLTEFTPSFLELNPSKLVQIDFKEVLRKHWNLVLDSADQISKYTKVFFSMGLGRKVKYNEFIELAKSRGYDFMFY